ncbi:type II toxin-antitoxin system HicA family toxin [Euhalothece natronophila Z-M001]|uniref:Type II toxin-antitoxin system HicA family toxin n=1 Tax=Euhalothece natronophila Z-M001 TaxID=522448 RepID=A0A5B8NQ63_9CHRO|nr:type II toxin-antitoxin system HicA family toxin [Euhalothece natronophila]QDZ41168.1 type II toxin-antitoxin system HicA family toxin [Euhalothece natronophila Z-M001]
MKTKTITFAELKDFLFNFGFETLSTAGSQKVFKHFSSGALIALPYYQESACIRQIHLVAIRRILLEYRLVDEETCDRVFTQKISLS